MSWRERLAMQPELRDMARWPAIPLESLPPGRRKGFVRNQRIVAQVLAGVPPAQVGAQQRLSTARISQLLQRCLGGEVSAPPALSAGLIPYRNLRQRRRAAALPRLRTGGGTGGGTATAFGAVLEAVPAIVERFDEMIIAHLKDAPYAQLPRPDAYHKEFLHLLAEHHWPADQYPYTTHSQGYASVRRYLQARIVELLAQRQQRRVKPARSLGLAAPVFRAQRATQIDEHSLDMRQRIHLLLDDQLIALRLSRASVLVAVDVDTSCKLGYELVPTRSPNQQDLLRLIERCVLPWEPPVLSTPGLSYAPGACFPSGLPAAFPVSFGLVQFDNALMHQAHAVAHLLAEQMGSTLNFGWPKMPQVRQLVESVFDYLGEHVTHRVASTTGSHPTDPIKESRKNRKKPPVITYQSVDEALGVVLTEDNITPREALGGATALELYQDQCANHFVRYTPPWLRQQWQPFLSSVEVTLHWYSAEQRFPHVNFAYTRYQGPGLLRVAANTRRIRIFYDRRDIRVLHAYTLDGGDLGELYAPRPWRRFAHSLATRRYIHQHTQDLRLDMRDPLGSFFRSLLERRGKPEVALSLLRVYTEFSAGSPDGLHLAGGPNTAPAPGLGATYAWHSEQANHQD